MVNLVDLDLTPPKTGNEDLEAWLEENMRRLQKFLRQYNSSAAYGGMRYYNQNPSPATIGNVYEKIELFNQATPISPLFITFDDVNNELIIEDEGSGDAFVFFRLNFEGTQNVVYSVEARIDDGSGGGPQPSGDPLVIRVSSQDPYAEVSSGALAHLESGWGISMWVQASVAGAKFDVFNVQLEAFRVGAQKRLP